MIHLHPIAMAAWRRTRSTLHHAVPPRLPRLGWLLLCALFTLPALAQYNATIQGNVLDPSGAGISGAHLQLTNPNTGQIQNAVADATGRYRFVNLAPGQYQLESQTTGFAKATMNLTLDTNQVLEVPVKLTIASANANITVTDQPPVLDTAETRNELTIEADAVNSLQKRKKQ